MYVISLRCCKNEGHVSATTCSTRIRVYVISILYADVKRTFMYSTNRFRKATKCSAFLIFPGMASLIISSLKTERNQQMQLASEQQRTRIRQHVIFRAHLIIIVRSLKTRNEFLILVL